MELQMIRSLFLAAALSCGLTIPAHALTFTDTVKVDEFCAVSDLCKNSAFETSLPFTIDILVPTTATSDAVLVFTAWGDFNAVDDEANGLSGEYLIIEAEGFLFGNFLNSDPSDDIFADDGFAGGTREDVGNEYGSPAIHYPPGPPYGEEYRIMQPPRSGTAIIPLADLLPIIADGVFSITVWTYGGVNDGPFPHDPDQAQEFLQAQLTFETSVAIAAVPLPPASLAMGSALALMALRRRARRAA